MGDLFVLQLANGDYYYGRVIDGSITVGSFEENKLVYIYNATSRVKESIPPLEKEHLLIPPFFTISRPWLDGYFEVLENRPIDPQDIRPYHYFYNSTLNKYFDEKNNEIRKPKSGDIGTRDIFIASSGIDYEIAEALGIETDE